MGKQNNHFVYMLQCKDNSLYTGYTIDIDRRIQMHNAGKAAKYTRGRGPFTLVYCKSFVKKREALQMEYKIKQLSRKAKEELINTYQKGHDGNENAE